MNRLPKFGGDDGKWVYDRIMVVDCPNVIPKEQQDKQLLEKMYAERRGIVKKAVKALQTVIANGYRFTEPDSIAEARRDYQSANSTVISFYQLQRTSDMRYIIETTKTDAGTRVFPITEDVAQMFQAIIEDRNARKWKNP